jgi:hypothetical protein
MRRACLCKSKALGRRAGFASLVWPMSNSFSRMCGPGKPIPTFSLHHARFSPIRCFAFVLFVARKIVS